MLVAYEVWTKILVSLVTTVYLHICVLRHLLFFQMYCHFAEENLYMKSPKTVTNWTTGKVLAPHSCLPATVPTTGDTDASTLHAHQSTATLEPGCSGRVALWMSFYFFLK